MIFEISSSEDFDFSLTLDIYNFIYTSLIRLVVFFINRLRNSLHKYKKIT